MSVSIFKILTLVFVLSSGIVSGQERSESRTDSIARFKPTGIRIGADLAGIIKSNVTDGFSQKELIADVDFNRYFLVAEAGQYSKDLIISNGRYSNNGNYLRLGVDVNFLVKDPDRNMFFLGFRYGCARYDEQVVYLTKTDFGDQTKTSTNSGISAGWLELTTGLRVKIWKAMWMGYTGRLKFAASTPDDSPIAPYDIPGYGLTFKKPWWGFSYYVMIRIPFTKK